jgi:formylglycine-generating enzyme required for sulfatase activity
VILVIFGLLIAGFVFWKPLNVTYYKYRLGSDNPEAHLTAAKYLLEADAIEPVLYYYKNRYASPDVKVRLAIVDELCGFGDKGKELMREIFRERCKREMVLIPAGSFMMGSENGNPDERPVHKVTLDAFLMDKFEVTNEKYYVFVKCITGYTPYHWKSNRIPKDQETHPVVCILWDYAESYATWLKMQLPTEAEWEYACRADSTTEFYFGDNEEELGQYAWFDNNSMMDTHPVGTKQPNKWHLFDMHGNVWEWCQDRYQNDYYDSSPMKNPMGPSSGGFRVIRGGGWDSSTTCCSAAYRDNLTMNDGDHNIGFRVCCTASAP